MLNRQELGQLGEDLATEHLQSKGYQIVERNYYCSVGELDIIALQDDYLIFIEVKTKQNLAFASPRMEVDFRKQQKLYQVARHYITCQGPLEFDFRFDVIAILYRSAQDYQLSHLENAFSI